MDSAYYHFFTNFNAKPLGQERDEDQDDPEAEAEKTEPGW